MGHKDERKSHKKEATCLECGAVRTIIGRGLCGTCYRRLKRREELDTRYPARKRGPDQPVNRGVAIDLTTPSKVAKAASPAVTKAATVADAVLPPARGTDNSVRLQFLDRDQQLLDRLKKGAFANRRTLDQEIMFRLDQ